MADDPVRELIEGLFRRSAAGPATTAHPDDEALAALAALRRPDDADPVVLGHLAACDDCRGEWVEMRRGAAALEAGAGLEEVPWELERAAQGRPGRGAVVGPAARRAWRPGWLPLAAAALMLGGIALFVPWDRFAAPGPARSATGPVALEPIGPIGEVRAGQPLVFAWNPAPGATAYEVVVAEVDSGETVLRRRTVETSLALDAESAAVLEAGRDYRWLVRAERGVGRGSTGPSARLRRVR